MQAAKLQHRPGRAHRLCRRLVHLLSRGLTYMFCVFPCALTCFAAFQCRLPARRPSWSACYVDHVVAHVVAPGRMAVHELLYGNLEVRVLGRSGRHGVLKCGERLRDFPRPSTILSEPRLRPALTNGQGRPTRQTERDPEPTIDAAASTRRASASA